MLYMEPTPYLLPLVRELEAHRDFSWRFVFIRENTSQIWHSEDVPNPYLVLIDPVRRWESIKRIASLCRDVLMARFDVAELAGWSDKTVRLIWVLLCIRKIPFCVESDSHLVHSGNWWRDRHQINRLSLVLKTACFLYGWGF